MRDPERETHVPSAVNERDARIIDDLYPALRKFSAVTAPRDFEPDDVLHAALLSVLRSRPLHTIDDPGAYIRRAIVNEVKSAQRKAGANRRATAKLRSDDGAPSEYPSDLSDLLSLSPVARAVLYLHDIERMTFDELADQLGISGANARITATRARRKLRQLITEETSP